MCDYSLMGLPNRLAVEGEALIVHRFETGCIGLTAASDIHNRDKVEPAGILDKVKSFFTTPVPDQRCAVCIPPGARLLIRDIAVALQKDLALQTDAQMAEFTQMNTSGFRDAIRFANGVVVLMQRLNPGQRVTVLSLAPEEELQLPLRQLVGV
jgi:hypothetical protein